MIQLLSYSIFVICFLLTKEEITFKNEDGYDFDNYCIDIKTRIQNEIIDKKASTDDLELKNLKTLKRSQYASNAQNCRQNEKKGDKTDGTKCCYLSVLQSSKWYSFCGKIDKNDFDNFRNYFEKLKADSKDIFDDFKIDCFSKKFEIMIITLIMSLIYLF